MPPTPDALFRAAPTPLIGLDGGLRLTAVNRAAAALLGLADGEALGQPLVRFVSLAPEADGRPADFAWLMGQLRDHGRVTGYPLRVGRGASSRRLTTTWALIDPTDLSCGIVVALAAGEEVAALSPVKAKARPSEPADAGLPANALLPTVIRLAVGLAHEVGNPLTSISSLVQLLLADRPEARQVDDLLAIKGQIDRIGRTLHHLADLAQPGPMTAQPVELNGLVEEAVRRAGLGLRVQFKPDPTVAPVESRPEPLLHALTSLLINGVEVLSGDDDAPLSLTTRPGPDGGVTVILGGSRPLPDDLFNRVADPFFASQTVGTRGSGLGLWLARLLFTELGATLRVGPTATAIELAIPPGF